MTVWLVDIQRRKGDGYTIGPFATRKGAIDALRDYVGEWFPETYSNEWGEETVEVYERELQP